MNLHLTNLLLVLFSTSLVISTTASEHRPTVSAFREVPAEERPLSPRPLPPSPYDGLPTSVTVLQDHTVVRLAPTYEARRRGVVMKGNRLPVLEAVTKEGCSSRWYRVHDEAWICSREVAVSKAAPKGASYPIVSGDDLTPWRYGFVKKPTIEFRYSDGLLEEVREIQKGFGFGVERLVTIEGRRFYRTAEKTLVPKQDARITRGVSTYDGIQIDDENSWPVGWVTGKNAFAYDQPTPSKKSRIGHVERYTPFRAVEMVGAAIRFDEGAYLRKKDVRVARTAPRPRNIGPNEKWIDVDVSEQILTAYEGDTPVYAALVSTGRSGASKTKLGEYRIWVKVAAIAMDSTDDPEEVPEEDPDEVYDPTPEELAEEAEQERDYSLHEVPWSQFFFEDYALHGVYWHDGFGRRRSHGCVNLAPRVARWLFEWTQPHLPDGFWAIHSTSADPGTLVRVR